MEFSWCTPDIFSFLVYQKDVGGEREERERRARGKKRIGEEGRWRERGEREGKRGDGGEREMERE